MIYRVAIANIPVDVLAASLQVAGFSATLYPGAIGVGEWGREPTTVIEFATREPDMGTAFAQWVTAMLRQYGEQAAYVTKAGYTSEAFLWWSDGRMEVIG